MVSDSEQKEILEQVKKEIEKESEKILKNNEGHNIEDAFKENFGKAAKEKKQRILEQKQKIAKRNKKFSSKRDKL